MHVPIKKKKTMNWCHKHQSILKVGNGIDKKKKIKKEKKNIFNILFYLSFTQWQVNLSRGRSTLRITLCGIRVKRRIAVTSAQKHLLERNIYWTMYASTRVSLHIGAASAPNRSPERNTLLTTSANIQVRAVGRCLFHRQNNESFIVCF